MISDKAKCWALLNDYGGEGDIDDGTAEDELNSCCFYVTVVA